MTFGENVLVSVLLTRVAVAEMYAQALAGPDGSFVIDCVNVPFPERSVFTAADVR